MVGSSPPPSPAGRGSSGLSIAVIGARRARQGIGEFVARSLHRRGAEVCAVVGTSEVSAADASRNLLSRYGIRCRSYASLDALFAGEPCLEALAICSPNTAHVAALDAAATHVLHVLCDKPLIVAPPGAGTADRVAEIAGRFAARGRLLYPTTQWPCTLRGFSGLYPRLDRSRVRRFEMLLSPLARGGAMLIDSMPHSISMLRALTGLGRVEACSVRLADEDALVRFAWVHAGGAVEAEVVLRRCEAQPRPAGYALDGRRVRREVRMADYAHALVTDDGRRAEIEDPLEARVAGFLEAVRTGEATDVAGLRCEAAALDAVLEVVPA